MLSTSFPDEIGSGLVNELVISSSDFSNVDENVETEVVLLWAPHEKAGFSGKDNNAGKGRRHQKKRKIKYEMDRLPKGSHMFEFARAEQGS